MSSRPFNASWQPPSRDIIIVDNGGKGHHVAVQRRPVEGAVGFENIWRKTVPLYLETVYFEALTTTGLTSRHGEVVTRLNDFDAPQPGTLTLEEEQKQIDETLASLEDLFDGGNSLAGAKLSAERDDYYDLVIVLRSPKLNWQFNLTELRGRVPLTFLTKQLLAPFAVLIGEDRGVQGEPVEAVSTIVSDPGVVRAWRRIIGAPVSTSQPSRAATQSRQTSAAPGSPFKQPATPTPRRASPTRNASPDATPRPVTPVRPGAGHHANQPPMSPTPYKKAFVPTMVSSSSRQGSPSEPATNGRRMRESVMTDVTIPPSSPPAIVPSSDSAVPSSDIASSDLPSSQMPMSTQDPLMPSQADKPRRKRKKDKAAELAEEEAEADRRRAEMKRKMQAGAKKGGGLGRRRF
ncbi:hypothetical protein A1Q1_01582 [Trichosporon asahii var. asahii CBS 2479]|uniref:Uncharacterized protein n=1 Tax=Trichosporon asahii var. asahii (strain ATCC 90039 / CBS 2479 / JCM 2466 / KCTC 7840 / NBRC 103889/ NCYC 2677 / UAMH 7654) TaxID=1186058 RepID=J4UDW5_TRIAS|nr:hypothetical protein A1Q1_01582 [Trichosporon asahii var. asahii CBS 2479]EJT49380.1 hypothetical protein A1Q1_01582 [Trichosporon asahii var. asahii CBS 2479]